MANSSTGLYKTPLTIDEPMSCDAGGVWDLEASPRELTVTDASGMVPTHDVEPQPAAQDLFAECQATAAGKRVCTFPSPSCFLDSSDTDRALCDAELVL